jgi:hypothetical protein
LALPNYESLPPKSIEGEPVPTVPLLILSHFRAPEICIGCRQSRTPTTPVTVPKTAMHKNYLAVARQHNIRLPRQILPMKPKAKTESV